MISIVKNGCRRLMTPRQISIGSTTRRSYIQTNNIIKNQNNNNNNENENNILKDNESLIKKTSTLMMDLNLNLNLFSNDLNIKNNNNSGTNNNSQEKKCYKGGGGVSKVGLFGIKELESPTGWTTLFDRCHERGQEIMERLAATRITERDNTNTLSEICYLIDELSQTICELMDPAELCRSVMHGSAHGIAADTAYNRMSEFVHQLNSNQMIYDLFKAIYQHPDHSSLPPAHRIFVADMMNESEVNGIHLPENIRNEIITYKNDIAFHGQQFLGGSRHHGVNAHYVYADQSSLSNVPREYIQHLAKRGSQIRIDSSPYTMSGILKFVDDPCIRKNVYQNSKYYVSNDVEYHLESFINIRDMMAKKLKYPTYASYHLSTKLIETPEKATQFLNNLSAEIREQSDSELNLIHSYKCKMEYTGDPVYQWDIPYYTNLIRNKLEKSKDIPRSSELAEYFTLENVIEGFNTVVSRLFGLRLREVPMAPGEVWSNDVLKLELYGKAEGALGYCYLDPWYRADKLTTGAANFVLHLGYRRTNFNQPTLEIPIIQDYHTPSVAVVCSFNPTNKFPVQDHRKAMLDVCDVEVLFHEFGHCMHNLLSRTDFQHLAGTRGPVDFAEIPSTLMENFTWDYRTLTQFAHHHITGKPILEKTIKAYHDQSNLFKAIDTQNQITLSMLDLTLHGQHPLTRKPGDILGDLSVNYSKILGGIGAPFVQNFSHLYYYGSCYYSYLLSKHNSNRIWKKFFGAGEAINRDRGEMYRRKFLQKGATQSPQSILLQFP